MEFPAKVFPGSAVTIEISNPKKIKFKEAWVQDLGKADHAREIADLDHGLLWNAVKRSTRGLCITCHGNAVKEGSSTDRT